MPEKNVETPAADVSHPPNEQTVTAAVPPAAPSTKGKTVVATAGDVELHVGHHHVTSAGVEVGPHQLKDIQAAADANGIFLHVIGEES